MIIRQDFYDMPPPMFLMQITDKLTKLYCFLWEKKDESNRISMTWEYLTKNYSKNHFRSSLRKLCHEGLLNYNETPEGVSIEMVGWDDIEK